MQSKDITKKVNGNTGDSLIEEMFRSGVHYGYSKSRRHPSASSFIFATKNRSDIIDLEKTEVALKDAEKFIENLGAKGKTLLLVGTKPEAKDGVKSTAESLNMPYVTERWIGGTLSNFSEIKKRIAELENYHKDMKEGALEKYTKKERVVLSKKMARLSRYYTGLLGLKKIPDALFIVDGKSEHIALAEALQGGIPVVSLLNSDSDIRGVDYPIIGNDSGIPSIKFFLKSVADAYHQGAATLPEKAA